MGTRVCCAAPKGDDEEQTVGEVAGVRCFLGPGNHDGVAGHASGLPALPQELRAAVRGDLERRERLGAPLGVRLYLAMGNGLRQVAHERLVSDICRSLPQRHLSLTRSTFCLVAPILLR